MTKNLYTFIQIVFTIILLIYIFSNTDGSTFYYSFGVIVYINATGLFTLWYKKKKAQSM